MLSYIAKLPSKKVIHVYTSIYGMSSYSCAHIGPNIIIILRGQKGSHFNLYFFVSKREHFLHILIDYLHFFYGSPIQVL